MKKLFHLTSRGFDCPPSFDTLTAARKALRELAAAEKSACRRRFGCAFVVWSASKDSARVLIGKDSQAFNLWSAHAIVAA